MQGSGSEGSSQGARRYLIPYSDLIRWCLLGMNLSEFFTDLRWNFPEELLRSAALVFNML